MPTLERHAGHTRIIVLCRPFNTKGVTLLYAVRYFITLFPLLFSNYARLINRARRIRSIGLEFRGVQLESLQPTTLAEMLSDPSLNALTSVYSADRSFTVYRAIRKCTRYSYAKSISYKRILAFNQCPNIVYFDETLLRHLPVNA